MTRDPFLAAVLAAAGLVKRPPRAPARTQAERDARRWEVIASGRSPQFFNLVGSGRRTRSEKRRARRG